MEVRAVSAISKEMIDGGKSSNPELRAKNGKEPDFGGCLFISCFYVKGVELINLQLLKKAALIFGL